MDPLWLTVAFLCGFLVRQVGLPPLVGFLMAGFILNAMGIEGGTTLQVAADLGVTLLLFTIGLKLELGSLFKPRIWAGASLHMLVTVGFLGLAFAGFAHLGLAHFTDLDTTSILLIAFALSFSSTVFAVKILEEKGEMASVHGSVAIGILIMQDVLAVVFLTASTGKLPSPWAIVLVAGLILVRPYLFRIMDRCDHGELTILFGFFLALVVGAESFEAVAMKSDLGALIIGMLVAKHPKAKELAKSLLGFKEIFLIGFFLSIGLAGIPTLETLGIAVLLCLLIPVKVALFFVLLCGFKLRARSSLLSSFSLANYSEFGLIVGAVGVANGWIAPDWLVIIAVALSLTFVLASPLNSRGDGIYSRYQKLLLKYERRGRHPDDLAEPWRANIAVFGMGRIGIGAYEYLKERCGANVRGVDLNTKVAQEQKDAGRDVVLGDATDPDFWESVKTGGGFDRLELVLLAMPKHRANMSAVQQLRKAGYGGTIAAIAMYEDQLQELKAAGVHAAFNFYAEAGAGFAEHVYESALAAGILPRVCQRPA